MALFIQMSGVPGSGKSTLARLIGKCIGAVVLDHDVTKSALLEAGISWQQAGKASYITLCDLTRSLLGQGHNVIFDSPCIYEDLLNAGLHIAEETGASYRYIECTLEDLAEVNRRLGARSLLPSQRRSLDSSPNFSGAEAVSGETLFQHWLDTTQRPSRGHLKVDTSKPKEECLRQILDFLARSSEN